MIIEEDIWSLFLRGSAKLILEEGTPREKVLLDYKGETKSSIRFLEWEGISGIVASRICIYRFVNNANLLETLATLVKNLPKCCILSRARRGRDGV